jgi:hypothetical protein
MSLQVFTNPFITCENAQERLIYLRGILHRKWKDIRSEEFQAIPVGTLYKIMRTGAVPKKWWKTLGIKSKRQPRIAVSKVDMEKAAISITRNITKTNILELTYLLNRYLYEHKGEVINAIHT